MHLCSVSTGKAEGGIACDFLHAINVWVVRGKTTPPLSFSLFSVPQHGLHCVSGPCLFLDVVITA